MTRLRIGTRGSALALWQANHIAASLKKIHGVDAELVRIRTSGDRLQTASVAQVNEAVSSEGGKGIFIKEIEDALLTGAVDLAVHSMKDVPAETPPQLIFAAIPSREDPRDCLLSRGGLSFEKLPQGARIGTSSLRRQVQLHHHRPDLEVLDMRGNVDTRIRKLESGDFDAIVLAIAGLMRLGLRDKVTQIFDEDSMLPAVGQGALGIETRTEDRAITQLVAALDHADTRACVTAERALLRELQGGCQVPLGAWGRIRDGELHLEAAVFSTVGCECVRLDEAGAPVEAEAIGVRLAQSLLDAGADKILRLSGRSVGSS
ncbi:MAG TPA: hydroxymethylbilane synthase [Candidatus Aquilonibacter sp.]|nr:hydroxymethylbilane synthase [Candidatus Aquilonibacter sp.]